MRTCDDNMNKIIIPQKRETSLLLISPTHRYQSRISQEWATHCAWWLLLLLILLLRSTERLMAPLLVLEHTIIIMRFHYVYIGEEKLELGGKGLPCCCRNPLPSTASFAPITLKVINDFIFPLLDMCLCGFLTLCNLFTSISWTPTTHERRHHAPSG